MLIAVVATTLMVQPRVLLAAFPYDGNGLVPLTEHLAKESKYLQVDEQQTQVVLRNAHVLCLPITINTPQSYQILVKASDPLEFGTTDSNVNIYATTYQNQDMLVAQCTAGTRTIELHHSNATHSPTGAVTGGTFEIYVNYYDQQQGQITAPLSITFARSIASEDTGIDTRRSYLDANKPVVDPNQSLRHLNFGDWTYNGGLFAGQILTPDRSGVGRTQLNFPTITIPTGLRAACLSLLRMPVLPPGRGATSLGVYMIRKDDEPQEGFPTEMQQTWGNRLPVTTNGQIWDGHVSGTGETLMLNETAITALTHVWDENDRAEDYLCWQIKPALRYEVAQWHFINRLVVANPYDYAGPGGYAWRSFASKEYQALNHSFPYNDVAPRIWIVSTGDGQ